MLSYTAPHNKVYLIERTSSHTTVHILPYLKCIFSLKSYLCSLKWTYHLSLELTNEMTTYPGSVRCIGIFSEVHATHGNFSILCLYFNNNLKLFLYQLHRPDFLLHCYFKVEKHFYRIILQFRIHNWCLWAPTIRRVKEHCSTRNL